MNSAEQLTKLLVSIGLLKVLPHPDVYQHSGEGPIRFFSKKGAFDEQEAIKKVGDATKTMVVDLRDSKILEICTVKFFQEKVDPLFCWNQKMVPLYELNNAVVVACTNPLNREAVQALQFSLGQTVILALAEELKISRLLTENFPIPRTDAEVLASMGTEEHIEIISFDDADISLVDEGRGELPTVGELCSKILAEASKEGASDIHIEPLQNSVDVRFRIDGVMTNMFDVPKGLQAALTSRIKLLAGMDIAERRRPQDGRIRVKIGHESLDLRVSSVPTAAGEKLVLRLFSFEPEKLTFENLLMPPLVSERIKDTLRGEGRILLVTGPTGSGKTTTLYTFLNSIKDGTTNIETIEDPIEYRLGGVSQIQVNESINMSFASALRSVLRQDPDVIMVGEIRDKETAEIALQAGQTGHLVLSTLHTNDAPSAISRLINLGLDRFTVSNGLAGVLSQRLVRRLCTKCREPDTEAQKIWKEKYASLFEREELSFQSGKGCHHCGFSGYKGRIGVYSYLHISPEVSELIQQGASLWQIAEAGKKTGFKDISEALVDLLASGESSLVETKDYLHREVYEGEEKRKSSSTLTVKETVKQKNESPSLGVIKKTKILLVDDDPDVREVFHLVLSREMFEVVEAVNGQQALEKVYQEAPDLVLCDLMMPVMDGKDFLVKMKRNEQTKKIPIVMLTAASTEANEVSLLDLGAKEFLSKASSSQVILARVRRALSL